MSQREKVKRYALIRSIVLLVLMVVMMGCTDKKEDKEYSIATDAAQDATPDEVVDTTQDIEGVKVRDLSNLDNVELSISYVSDLLEGNYAVVYKEYNYTGDMKKAVSELTYKQIMDGLKIQLGDFVEIMGTKVEEDETYSAVFVNVKFANGAIAFRVVLDQEQKIAGFFMEEYKEESDQHGKVIIPENMTSQEIEFGNEPNILPGTLWVPTDVENPTIVIFVHGSGPNDRNESYGPNKTFEDIAIGLAKEGIGSLRYDKRTYIYGGEFMNNPQNGLYEETIEDAYLAVKYIHDSLGKDVEVIVLGHSLGGYSIPYIHKVVLENNETTDGYIIMAGNVRGLDELFPIQYRYLFELDGVLSAEEQENLDFMEEELKKMESLDILELDDTVLGLPVGYWKTLNAYKPLDHVNSIQVPIHIIQGSRDYQVTEVEFNLWKTAFEGNNLVTFDLIEGVNHLMIFGEGTPNPTEYDTPSTVDKKVIDSIITFIETLD